jgi:fatty-acid desaturase
MKTRAWHRSLVSLIGFPSLAIAAYIDPYWLVATFFIYFIVTISVSAGYHRLFTHGSYSCNKIWHWFLGITGCIGLNSSPVQWAIVHSAHHKHSDTLDDPHDRTWRYYFRFKDRTNLKPTRKVFRLMRDPMHKFFVHHSLSISLFYASLTLILGGLWGLLFFYLAPVGFFLIVSGAQAIFSHSNGHSIDRPLMEFILPLSGEWLHKDHHDKPMNSQLTGGLDLGGAFINLIKTDDIKSTNRKIN